MKNILAIIAVAIFAGVYNYFFILENKIVICTLFAPLT